MSLTPSLTTQEFDQVVLDLVSTFEPVGARRVFELIGVRDDAEGVHICRVWRSLERLRKAKKIRAAPTPFRNHNLRGPRPLLWRTES